MSSWTRQIVDAGYILAMVQRPTEDTEDTLDRINAAVEHGVVHNMIDPKSRIAGQPAYALHTILTKAFRRGIALSVPLLAREAGANETQLREAVEENDITAILFFADKVVELSEMAAIRQGLSDAEAAVRAADTNQEALDAVQHRISRLLLSSDRDQIKTLTEADELGWEQFFVDQENLRSGKVRFTFPKMVPTINEKVPFVFNGNMILLTAKTKVGKTSMGGQIFDWNLKCGLKGIYFRFEDPDQVDWYRRLARVMGQVKLEYPDKEGVGLSVYHMIKTVISDRNVNWMRWAREKGIMPWSDNGISVYCPGWTSEKMCAVWEARARAGQVDFVVVDYLNKMWLTPSKLKNYGLFASRGKDAELIKTTAERTGTVAVLIQQEGDNGLPYETRQSAMKSQVYVSLRREWNLSETEMLTIGKGVGIQIVNANLGATGWIPATFYTDWMLWRE